MPSEEVAARLAAHGRTRDALLRHIVEVLQGDGRIVAAWLAGSLAIGTADAWSDVDLHVAVSDEHYSAVVEGRMALYERFGRPALVQQIRVNTENPGVHFNLLVYPGGIEVDCSLWPQRLAHRPPWTRLLFDRADVPVDILPPMSREERRQEASHQLDFFWAMATVAMKTVGRSYASGAALTIELMTDAFDSLWRLVYRPEEPHPEMRKRRHRPAVPELVARPPRLGATIDPLSALAVIRRQCLETERLHPVLAELGVPIPADMPGEVAALGELAEAAARRELERPSGPM